MRSISYALGRSNLRAVAILLAAGLIDFRRGSEEMRYPLSQLPALTDIAFFRWENKPERLLAERSQALTTDRIRREDGSFTLAREGSLALFVLPNYAKKSVDITETLFRF
ncbi:MAG: hypothetical protein ABW189_06520 [Rickettsiales bacterium]